MSEKEPQRSAHRLVDIEKSGISKQVFFVCMALVALVSFVAGTRQVELYAAIAPLFGKKASSESLELSIVQNTYRELKAHYDGKIDPATLADGAARGMVQAADDRYTVFMDKQEAETFAKELSGEVTGIGCELGVRGDRPTVLRVLKDSPAEQVGLLAGDIFVTVNDEDVAEADSATVASKIRGQEGTTVKVAILRAKETKTFSITRAKLNDPSVRSRVEGALGVLMISRFDSDTGRLAREAARGFKDQGVTSVILDLRDDGGGYLDAAQDVASLWLSDKVIVTEKTGDKVTDTIKAKGEAVLSGVKTVVLVNGNSASASEIVAGALQEHQAATLLGEKTYGKGSVQRLIDLPGGRQLKVTVARWYTPNGRNITKEGITPDTTIALTSEDRNANRDPQLDAAKKSLSSN